MDPLVSVIGVVCYFCNPRDNMFNIWILSMSICRGLAKSGTPQLKLYTSHDFILVVYFNIFRFVIKPGT